MIANKTLLQRKYARVISAYAERCEVDLRLALDVFYNSMVYIEMSQGVSDMHCRSDGYLAEEIEILEREHLAANALLDVDNFS